MTLNSRVLKDMGVVVIEEWRKGNLGLCPGQCGCPERWGSSKFHVGWSRKFQEEGAELGAWGEACSSQQICYLTALQRVRSVQERWLWDWSFRSFSLEANRITFVMWEA